ncbi:hypothetical protein BpHYR1_047305 [Brachionus plicatilis]|uniref:Uncharacterized protein n=1 Tax=Brachionus plicatilis TaxID=10195 RepID=A0A3M7T0C7_BRAPC|nr:hypothetical protein BpHYR1_047305 [Brachionus plicatilis]
MIKKITRLFCFGHISGFFLGSIATIIYLVGILIQIMAEKNAKKFTNYVNQQASALIQVINSKEAIDRINEMKQFFLTKKDDNSNIPHLIMKLFGLGLDLRLVTFKKF